MSPSLPPHQPETKTNPAQHHTHIYAEIAVPSLSEEQAGILQARAESESLFIQFDMAPNHTQKAMISQLAISKIGACQSAAPAAHNQAENSAVSFCSLTETATQLTPSQLLFIYFRLH